MQTLTIKKTDWGVSLHYPGGKLMSYFINKECAVKWCKEHGYKVKTEKEQGKGE
jgi:hypothetical protein